MPSRRPTDRDLEFRDQVHGSQVDKDLARLARAPDLVIEARGTFCPEPVIRTQNAAATMPTGAVAMLLADDMGVELDIPAWCMSTGNEYLGLLREPDFYRVFLRKR